MAAAWAVAAAVAVASCEGAERERTGDAAAAIDAPLPAAFCDIQIEGGPLVSAELDYLPNLLQCEHGGAGLETLKAQAIAARSVAYWYMATYGEICDSQSCQVYSCGKTPDPIHQQAVDETSGVYLAFNGNLTYASYLAGDPGTAPPDCVGQNETYVTYNEGKTGTDVEQTALLFQHDPSDAAYGQNRGCMSQNGASCLEDTGYTWLEILRFYYGSDIEVLQAPGPCVLPLPAEGGGGAGGAPGATGSSTGASQVGSSTASGASDDGAGGGVGLDGGDDDEGCGCAVPGAGGAPREIAALSLVLSLLALLRRRASSR